MQLESDSLDNEFDAIERRIRMLTTLLQYIQRHNLPDEPNNPTPGFLDHLIELFQARCTDENDGDSTNIIAMTGTETPDGLRILVVTEGPSNSSEKVQVTRITKSNKAFDEVINRRTAPKLTDHISDIWRVLASFDENIDQDTEQRRFLSLAQFIFEQKFWKISDLIKEIGSSPGIEVSRTLLEWEPRQCNLQESRWITLPSWLVSIRAAHKWHNQEHMKERKVVGLNGEGIQWLLSEETAKAWIGLLANILDKLASEVQKYKDSSESQSMTLENILSWSSLLSSYLHWTEGVLENLLKGTSFKFSSRSSDDSGSEPVSGERVFRHMERIVAWYDALHSLCFDKKYSSIRESSGNHATCLVEIPASGYLNATRDDTATEFIRQLTPSAETLKIFETVLDESYTAEFSGSIHAEAMLMGLVTCFSPNTPATTHGVGFQEETRAILEEFILPLPATKDIVLNRKSGCCACCRWLGTHLHAFKLPPSTSGKFQNITAWSPPRVGVEMTKLRELEANLLDEFDFRLRLIKLSTFSFDQLDTTSDDGSAPTISDYSSPEDREFDVSD